MATQEDMIRKISAILKKAEGTDNENEAASFFAAANELMLKYAIDEQRVREETRAREGAKVESPRQNSWMYATHDAHAKAKETLIHAVARSQHVRFTPYSNKPGSNRRWEGNEGRFSQWGSLTGYGQDIENVKTMYASLLIQWARYIRTDTRNRRAEQEGEWSDMIAAYPEQTRFTHDKFIKEGEYGFRTGHLEGFAHRVGARLQQQERDFLAMAHADALMVNKDAEISAWMKSQEEPKWYDKYCLDYSRSKNAFCGILKGHVEAGNPKHEYTIKAARRSGGGRRDVDGSGYAAGSAAGNLADLGGPSKLR